MDHDLAAMLKIAGPAGQRALAIQHSPDQSAVSAIHKASGPAGADMVTAGDLAAQEFILQELDAYTPGLPVVSEEKENQPDIPPDCWLVDPIDGTRRYMYRSRVWGMILARLQQHQPVAGVINLPGQNLVAYAARGEGCFINGHPVRLGSWPTEQLPYTLLGTEFGEWWRGYNLIDLVFKPLTHRFGLLSDMSGAYGQVTLLQGEVAAWFNLNIGMPWDYAAGALLVKESGGWVSDAAGDELDFTKLRQMDVVFAASEQFAKDHILPVTAAWAKQRSISPHLM